MKDNEVSIEVLYKRWLGMSLPGDAPLPKPAEELTPKEVEQIEEKGAVIKPEPEPRVDTMRIDLHCHSQASPDSSSPFEEILQRCVEKGITLQAITDHNVIWGAQKLQEMVHAQSDLPVSIIVGEEISTTEGELIGLYLTEKVEGGMTPEKTVEAIEKQGGLVLLPHGFDPLKRWHLRMEARQKITSSIDVVETFNARISRPHWNRVAVRWAEKHGVPMSAGSDAHTVADIGSAWTEVPARPVSSPAELLDALRDGVPVGVWTQPVIAFLLKMVDRTRRRIRRWTK